MAEPNEANIPDPHLAQMEAALEREREVSRIAAAQLSMLHHREAQIAFAHRPPDASPPPTGSGWTTDTLMAHLLALREGDRRFMEERDRRYAEVNVEKEKALKIKETADLAALQLAREIQTYKDEKANELREQISSERGHYASKDDLENTKRELTAMVKPLAEWVSSQQGIQQGGAAERTERRAVTTSSTAWLIVGLTLAYTLIAAIGIVAASGGFK